jgi:hypothetical protein
MKKSIISRDELYNIWCDYDILQKISYILARKIDLINRSINNRLDKDMAFKYRFNLCDIDCVPKEFGLNFINLYKEFQKSTKPDEIYNIIKEIKKLLIKYYKWDNYYFDDYEIGIINIALGEGGDIKYINDFDSGEYNPNHIRKFKIKYSKPKDRLNEEDENELLDHWNKTGLFIYVLDNLKDLSNRIISDIYMSNDFSKKDKINIIENYKKYCQILFSEKEMDVSVLFNTICDLYYFMMENIPDDLCKDSLVAIERMFSYKKRDVFDDMETYRETVRDYMRRTSHKKFRTA